MTVAELIDLLNSGNDSLKVKNYQSKRKNPEGLLGNI